MSGGVSVFVGRLHRHFWAKAPPGRPQTDAFLERFSPFTAWNAAPFFALFLSAPQNFLGAPFFQFFAATPARRSCPKTPRIARSARSPSHEFFDRKLFARTFFFPRTNFGSKKCSMNFIYFSNQIFQYFFHISKNFSPAALGRNAIVISVFVLIAMRF